MIHRTTDRAANPESFPADYILPCDVKIPPATIIGKGCKLSTLMNAIQNREGMTLRFEIPSRQPAGPDYLTRLMEKDL